MAVHAAGLEWLLTEESQSAAAAARYDATAIGSRMVISTLSTGDPVLTGQATVWAW
jgi:hypothetical protein